MERRISNAHGTYTVFMGDGTQECDIWTTDNLNDAIKKCNYCVEGLEPVHPEDNSWEGTSKVCHAYVEREATDGEPIGEIIHQTKWYYKNNI